MQKVYVIAEIGINHNGSENHARKLIDQAYRSGCHAVKFQKRNPDLCVPEAQKDLKRETPWGVMTYLEYKWKIEFSVEQYQSLRKYTKSLGMDFLSISQAIKTEFNPDPNLKLASEKEERINEMMDKVKNSMNSKSSYGGTAEKNIKKMIRKYKREI